MVQIRKLKTLKVTLLPPENPNDKSEPLRFKCEGLHCKAIIQTDQFATHMKTQDAHGIEANFQALYKKE